jgi:hypothetical protein
MRNLAIVLMLAASPAYAGTVEIADQEVSGTSDGGRLDLAPDVIALASPSTVRYRLLLPSNPIRITHEYRSGVTCPPDGACEVERATLETGVRVETTRDRQCVVVRTELVALREQPVEFGVIDLPEIRENRQTVPCSWVPNILRGEIADAD